MDVAMQLAIYVESQVPLVKKMVRGRKKEETKRANQAGNPIPKESSK